MSEYDRIPDREVDAAEYGSEFRPSPWRSRETWSRLLFMILFAVIWGVAEVVAGAVVLIQFGWLLVTGAPNSRLQTFSQSLATYCYQIALFLMLNSELRPFPFMDWPQGPPETAGDADPYSP
jgi:hypothetical protein